MNFIGELALTGELRPVRGTLPTALRAREAKRSLVMPEDNAKEGTLADGASILSAPSSTRCFVNISPFPREIFHSLKPVALVD